MCFAGTFWTSMFIIHQSLCRAQAMAGLLLVCAVVVFAQGGSIQGQLLLPDGSPLNESTRISLETLRGVKGTLFTDNQGRFNFPGLTPGAYQVIVEGDGNRYETTTANVEVFPSSPALLTITLKEKKDGRTKGNNSVSATELDTEIPPKAKKEFERASAAVAENKPTEAMIHLRQAIAIYPRYLKARNDLGAQLLEQGKLDEAADELRLAVEIDSKAFNPHLNLGIVLVRQHKFAEAGAILAEAVALNAGSPAARLYNGLALEGLKDFEAAERELKAAFELGSTPYAVALFHLGLVLMSKGERERAAAAFESYLREAPQGANAREAAALLRTLK